jgi:ATP-dependent helicase/DNAse subunit B
MGMLETRLLDFEALVMLSVNEDFIPAGKSGQSIIPNEIRREFSLPTYEERNAVFAYHFYRLLQQTKKAYLIYNTEADDLGGGDVSRFVTQLKNELPKYNPEIKITEQILTLPQIKINIKPIVVPKNESILNRLNELALSGLSASSLNVYRSCSLRFYFQYVKRIQEAEELEETIEAATLGSVIHDVLRNLYFPYVGKVISKEMLLDMKSKSALAIQDSFSKHFVGGDINFGKNLLIKHVAESYINKFLQKEINDLSDLNKFNRQLTIVSLEEEFTKEFTIDSLPVPKEIRLKGYVDRIDRVGERVRIIDYKTGNVAASDLVFKEWEDFATNPKLDKCFQLLFYSYLCTDKIDRKEDIQSGIISFRNMGGGFMPVHAPVNNEDSDSQFEALLNTILNEIYDTETPFTQTDELANCAYCPYVSICGR